MSIIDNAKEIADLIKKIGDVELYRRIVELEGEIIELTRAKRQAEGEIERLGDILKRQEQMEFRKPFYFTPKDNHPFCPQCWEVNKVVVHLNGPINLSDKRRRYECFNCKSAFIT
jgi:hypothetical protein